MARVLQDGENAGNVDRAVRKWRGGRPTWLLLLERSGGEAGGFGGCDIVVDRLPPEELSSPHNQWRGDDEEWDRVLARYRWVETLPTAFHEHGRMTSLVPLVLEDILDQRSVLAS